MTEHLPIHEVRETRTLRMARFVVRHRAAVMFVLIATTLFFLYPTVNAILTAYGRPLRGPVVRVDASERSLWPQHPFIAAQDKFAAQFGTSSMVVIAAVVKDGTIFTPEIIQTIDKITRRLDGVGYDSKTEEREELRTQLEDQGVSPEEINKRLDRTHPPYPVNHYQIQSIAHGSTRVIQIEPDGAITSDVLMKKVPETQQEADALRELVRQNPPFIFGRLVSRDEKGALIAAGFVTDRLSAREVYQAIFEHVGKIKQEFEASECRVFEQRNVVERTLRSFWEAGRRLFVTVTPERSFPEGCNLMLYVSGGPIHVGWLLKHAFEIGLFVSLTILVTFALLLAYFRRLHGVLIPFVAAVTTALWGLGFTGWMGITFDPLVLVIPMMITARATSHTVQMAERFFEDYELILPRMNGDADKAKVEAATVAMAELIVPGSLGIVTDFLGLLVILITTIQQMRDLAIFGSFWVLAILATVEILHPVMICYLPAPHESAHFTPAALNRFLRRIGEITTGAVGKWVVAGISIGLLVWSTWVTLTQSTIGESNPGSFLLWPDHEFNVATAEIADRFGGVDSLVVYANGDRKNASADAEPVLKMEEFERFMFVHTDLGASVSLVPFIRGSWQMNHYGDPKWHFVPVDAASVRGIIFQLQTNGPPGFLRPFMTDDGKDANIAFFYPDHKGDTIRKAVVASDHFIEENPIGEVSIRLDVDRAERGAPLWNYDRLTDAWYYMLGPLIQEFWAPRNHTMSVRVRENGGYAPQEIKDASEEGLPSWIGEFREAAVADYEETKGSWPEDRYFPWPDSLAAWETDDVDAWWESEELGLRAVAVNTDELIVHDLKAVDGVPKYQSTNSWTRGMQFVMAGGSMGVLAAINDEVERGHVANIALILFVVFVLQAFTYRSWWSGTIIVLQLSTATMLSLAYMALKGVGLNVNTLPVQSVGVGIGVDYAIYIVDRIQQEVAATRGDIDEAIRRAIRTTGMAVSFTATTIVGGIALWSFSSLRFQAEMAQLLMILMVINMIGAITMVPALYAIIKPKFARALLEEEEKKAHAPEAASVV
jgi:predicted RND superfamily exporter protein